MRRLIIIFLFFVHSFSADSQLDSISVNAYFDMVNLPTEEGDSIFLKIIRTETWVNDFDFFGEIIVTAYDEQTGYPVNKVKNILQSVVDNGLNNAGVITVELLGGIEEGRSYRVDVLVRNYQGMNLPITSVMLY